MHTPYSGLRRKFDTSVFRLHNLSNGVPVWIQNPPITLHDEGAVVVTFSRVGSIQDPIESPGGAHVFEHVPFRGTERFPSAGALRDPVEHEGGSIGATTSRYWTTYRCRLPQPKFALAAEVAYQLAFKALMREEDIEKEKSIIQSELTRFFSDGSQRAYLNARKAFFGENPHTSSVIGTKESVAAMKPEQLVEFRQRFYHSQNVEIICGGSFSECSNLIPILESTFGQLPKTDQAKATTPHLPAPLATEVVLKDKNYRRDRLVMYWPIPCEYAETHTELCIIADALGRSLTSPVMKVLRLEKGLVYESGLLGFSRNPHFSLFMVNIPIPSEHFGLAERTVRESLKSLAEQSVVAEVEYVQKSRLVNFADPVDVCCASGGILTDLVMFGRPYSYHEAAAEIDGLEFEKVDHFRKQLLSQAPLIARIEAR